MTEHIDNSTQPIADRSMSGRSLAVSCDYLREIHHQIKNNLQVVCSLLRLESRQAGEGACRNALKRCEQRVQSMALLYDCIFRDYGALQVQFEEYLKGIISQAVKSLGGAGEGVEVQFELESVVLASKTAMSLGLIAHELVWESLQRFSPHEGQSTLVVSMQGEGSGLVLDIQDNFSSGGVEGEKMSLSSQIVGALVQQFHGELLQAPGSFRLAIPSLSL